MEYDEGVGDSQPGVRDSAPLPENVDDLIDRIVAGYERQSRIIRGIGHDFKSPLASVSLMVELLLGNELGPLSDRQRSGLTAVADSVVQLTRLADALYAVAESRDGSLELATHDFDLATVVRDIVGTLGLAAEVRGIALKVSGAPSVPMRSDRGRVERIVSNLVNNAVKYSDDGTVEVALSQTGNRVEIVVSDQGIGIPASELASITGPLTRGTNAVGRPGSGMGLAIVEQLVRDLHGTVSVDSEVDRGTVVVVGIPSESAGVVR